MFAQLADHISWLFRPGRFLFGSDDRRVLKVRGWETVFFVDRPADVRAVNRATGDVFLGGAGNAFLEALLGSQSVFLLDHERHRLARKIMGRTLTRRAVQAWVPVIDHIVDAELAKATAQRDVNLGAWSRRVTMRVLCRVALGQGDERAVERIYNRFEATTGYLANVVSYAKRFWKPRGRISIGAYVRHLVGKVDAELYPLIRRRQRQAHTRGMRPAESPIDALVAAQAEHGYDNAFIRDNLAALLAAGYDTTGSALTWMFYWIAREPNVASALRDAHANNDTAYLEAFRSEVLRYCPPVEILPRRIDRSQRDRAHDMVVGLKDVDGGDAGPMVCPFVHRIHHDPNVHAEPNNFDPERFLGERRYTPDQYLPFGAGPRMCLGINLGKLILDRVLARFLDRDVTFAMKARPFRPVRRNVSIWPGFATRARVAPLDKNA